MKPFLIFLTVFLLCSGLLVYGQSQQPSSDQAFSATLRSTAQEVVLDMVFRDKKGRTIHNIRPEDIHVLEDGVEQKLTSFRLVERGTASMSSPAAPVQSDPMRELRLVTLVFEGLDQDGKRFFRQALKDILDTAPEQNLFFSVLTIDQTLHVIQPFTADHSALLRSVDKSAMWSFLQYSHNSAEVKTELKQVVDQGEPTVSSSSGAPSPSAIQSQVNYRMAKMQYDMMEAAEAGDREYNARATLDALMALVRAQSELPGRKVVLYFNPSLIIPETVKEQYHNIISAANRANVSFYTVDPKGLITESQENMGRTQLKGAVGEIRAEVLRGGVGEVSTAQAQAAENAESALRSNPIEWLRDLAQQTGGTAIADTNDYKAPLRAVMEEVRAYYEAAYIPHISLYDGKFHKISVRVDRPNVVVHTRSGYFALPQAVGGQQLLAYEMPLLNVLNAGQAPHDLAFQAAAQRFNDHGPKIEYMLTLEAPLKEMIFAPQPDHKNAAVDAALLAVLKKPNGEIVGKFSKDFAVQVALDQVEAYKMGDLVQTFRTELFPGEYTLEAVIMDRKDNKLCVNKNTVTVPPASGSLSISDVVIVRRTDALKDNQIRDPFYFPGGKVVPTLTTTLKGGPGNILPFYFAVYPDRGATDPLKLTMSFYKDGQYLGAAQAPLPGVQPDGRIPYIANLPADKFSPGAYQIHIGITQGSSKVEKDIAFQVD